MKTSPISVERLANGALLLTTLVTKAPYAYYEHTTYYGYTIREARQLFRERLEYLASKN